MAEPAEELIGMLRDAGYVVVAITEIERVTAVIERMQDALREIATDDENYVHRVYEYRMIARAALGEEKPLEDRWDD